MKRVRADYRRLLVEQFGCPPAMLPVELSRDAPLQQKRNQTATLKRMYETRVTYRKVEEANTGRLTNPPPKRAYVANSTDLWLKQKRQAKAAYDAWAKSTEGLAGEAQMPDAVMILQSYDLYCARCRAEGRQPLPPPTH